MIVHIRPDPFDKKTWYSKEVTDLCAYLAQEFDVFPSNAQIGRASCRERVSSPV